LLLCVLKGLGCWYFTLSFPSLQAGVRCFEDEDDEQRLIETVLFLGLEWLSPFGSAAAAAFYLKRSSQLFG